MFIIYYNGTGINSKLDIRRTAVSYAKYALKNKQLPRVLIKG